jgi:nuclease S1
MDRMRRFVLSSCLLALAAASPSALAWGQLGHRLVAQLAERDLTPQARAQVDALLAGEPDPTLGGIASWADALREHDPDLGRRSAKWHYVNIGESGCRYQATRDCPNGDCVVEAIVAQTAILADTTRPRAERVTALKFVVHFVGDAHQPMHAGYAHDKGGNTHQINHRGRGTNLHAFWDSGMLNSAGRRDADWLTHLATLPAPAPAARVLPPPAQDWAEAACRIAVAPGVYPARGRLGQDYVSAHLPTVEQQLRDAGARLGTLLNAALAPAAP